MVKKCPVCGAEFKTNRSKQKYCSTDCYWRRGPKSKWQVKTSDETEKKCVVCGKKFTAARTQRKCCSPECQKKREVQRNAEYRAARNKGAVVRTCANCGKTFETVKRNKIYCSTDCYYESILKSAKKEHALAGDVPKCAYCGKKFVPTTPNQRFCSKGCCSRYSQEHAKKAQLLSKKTVEQWAAEARECGLSYGNYRLQVEHYGKTFEELKGERS